MNKQRKRNKQAQNSKVDVRDDATSVYTVGISEQVVFHQSVKILGWLPTTQAKPKDDE